jgi:uncharacterized membrane protein
MAGMRKLPLLLFCGAFIFGLVPLAHAQQVGADQVDIYKAQVLSVLSQEQKDIPGTQTESIYQSIRVEVLDGPDAGQTLTLDNDYLLLKTGDVFFVRHEVDQSEDLDLWSVFEPDRLPVLAFFAGLFFVILCIFGGWQGLRGLLSLCISLLLIGYVLLPGILAGYDPVLVAVGVSAFIIIVGSYLTHGFNRTTSVAVVGMLITVLLTGVLAYTAIHWGQLSGYTSEEASYLNIDTSGTINFVGLLLGAFMIGILGVLYDAAIAQAIAVEELVRAAPHYTRRQLLSRAIRVGREHIGALVNTLAIAYVGTSLPLLLYFKLTFTQSLLITANEEIFATEIFRLLVGSMGLVLAVPIVSVIAVYYLHGRTLSEAVHTHHH